MVDTSRTFFAVQRGCGITVLGKRLLCSIGKPKDSVPCHPITPRPKVPWCCSCHHWVGWGLNQVAISSTVNEGISAGASVDGDQE